jgi:hypothetical protein
MDGAYSTYGGRVEAYTGFWWGNLRERDCMGDPGVDGWIILRWIFRKWDVGVECIELDQHTNGWQTVVNVVMNLWVA